MNETVGKIFIIFEDFTYEGVNLNIIKILDTIWFRAKDIITVLGYNDTVNAIKQHVHTDDKKTLQDLGGGGTPPLDFSNKQPETNTLFK